MTREAKMEAARRAKMEAARRALLGILPRKTLEELSQSQYPYKYTKTELIALAVEKWDLDEVHDAVQRVFQRADPEGTQP